ncbi:ABC transporter permease subunit [Mesoaciditoga lauensis]|uniref:ABC transporter permease n=1 Tax=Mesoaciditoga lauensis TaxID=1495039 RepID=UPI000562EDC1|nr:ABC transporter permease subunit [Mesoaciditoga lauensis]
MTLFFVTLILSAILFMIAVARAKIAYVIALASLVFLVSFFPIVWGTFLSFFDFLTTSSIHFVGFKNIFMAFGDHGLSLSVKITALWALTVLLLKVAISYSLALSLSNLKKLSGFLYAVTLTPWAIPVYISIISWTVLIEGYGGSSMLSHILMTNLDLTSNIPLAFLTTAFVSTWLGIPMMTLVLLSSMQSIPRGLQDLSKMEGLDPLEKALNLYLPYTLPVAFPYMFLSFLSSFKEFTVFFLMTNGGPDIVSGFGSQTIVGATTSLGMLMYSKFYSTRNYGVVGAYSVAIGVVIMLLLIVGWNYQFKSRKSHLIISVLLTHAVFDIWKLGDGVFSVVPLIFYIFSYMFLIKKKRIFKKIFVIGAVIDVAYMIVNMLTRGFDGISVSAIISVVVAITFSFEGKIHVNPFKLSRRFWKVLKGIWLSTWSFGVFLPVWAVVFMALSRENVIPIEKFWPASTTFSNFYTLFQSQGFLRALENSLIISSLAVIMVIFTVFPAAWASIDSKGALKLGKTMAFASFFTGMHTLIPLAITFKFLGLLNTLWGISIAISAHSSVIAYFLILPFLQSIPKSLNEAAKLDGANDFSRMVKIYLPLSIPVLVTVGVYVFIEAWNSFVFPLILLDSQRLYPVSIVLYNFIGEYGVAYSKWNLFGAGSVVNMVIISMVFIFSRKRVMNGILTKGGI